MVVALQHADLTSLNKTIEFDKTTMEKLNKSNCDQCLDRIKILNTKAIEAQKEGNDENAYFFYMRTCEIAMLLSRKDRFKNMPPTKQKLAHEILRRSIENANQIQETLKNRYEAKEQERQANLVHKVTNETSHATAPIKQPSVSEFIKQTKISPRDLIRSLQNTEPAKSALIVDFREKRDSIIQYTRKNFITVVNVPASFIHKGLIFNNLCQQMPINDRTILCQLAKYDLIVLMEENDPLYGKNGDLEMGSKALILTEALYTYNPAYKPKHRPIVMEGGFRNWQRQYPVYTTEAVKEEELDPDSQAASFEIRIAKLQANYGIDFREAMGPVSYPSIPDLDSLLIDKPKEVPYRTATPSTISSGIDLPKVKYPPALDLNPRQSRRDVPQEIFDEQKPQLPALTRDNKPTFEIGDYRPIDKGIPQIDRSTKPAVPVLGGNRFEDRPPSAPITSVPCAPTTPQLDRTKKPTGPQRDPRMEGALIKAYQTTISRLEASGGRNENPGQVGLYNLGNTCFVSATLQCLFQTPFLNHFFCGANFLSCIGPHTKLNTGGLMAAVYSGLSDVVWGGRVKQIRPEYFLKVFSQINPYFSDGSQHDAQEFMINLLDALHEDTNRVAKPIPLDTNYTGGQKIVAESEDYIQRYKKYAESPISNIFDTHRVYELSCRTCERTSVTFEKWRMLSLEVRSRLEDCFGAHFCDERLEGEEMWECPSCKCKRSAIRKARIWSLPPVLIIHLMRFSMTDGGYVKNADPVYFERTLDVSPWLHPSSPQKKKRYVLYGVTNHRGSLNSGHYTAITQHRIDQSWVRYDDESATRVSTNAFDASAAFILFYKKEDV
ncbi:unnamed protein product, partial [Mesorhabditis belari]|uniref:Ubiquitin carboxyl-terminal hydrolase n=1 Tax=Mesorhabditis belari TaxID=2138241 RepID=A0AAF3EKY8_9BILA